MTNKSSKYSKRDRKKSLIVNELAEKHGCTTASVYDAIATPPRSESEQAQLLKKEFYQQYNSLKNMFK